VQPLKAKLPIEVTLFGMTNDFSPVQFWKVPTLIVEIQEGIVRDVSPVQLAKAYSPIEVIFFGIVKDVRFVKPSKAWSPSAVTVSGSSMVVFGLPENI
jgi:hypothetical protein